MLELVMFAVTFVVVLVAAVIYLYHRSKQVTTIPGLNPSNPRDGNLPDIDTAGGMHEFLMQLHKDHGPIASFWWGPKLAVSIASAELFKEQESISDKPLDLFANFWPLIGEASMQFANGANWRIRRHLYDKAYSHESICYSLHIFNEVADELVKKLKTLPKDEHIPLKQYCMALVFKGITRTSFGDYFEDEKALLEYKKSYDICFHDMEDRVFSGPPEEGSDRDKKFKQVDAIINNRKQNPPLPERQLFIVILLENNIAVSQIKNDATTNLIARDVIHGAIDAIIKRRKESPPPPERQLFIDILLENNLTESQIQADAISYILGGFGTTGHYLAWVMYFIATHNDVQDKIYEEVHRVLGEEDFDPSHIPKLVYIKQVLDESLRCSVIATWTARFQDIDTMLGGHVIPKGTRVIHALGVTQQDEQQWPHPKKFDPDRFSRENNKKRDRLAFQPFGFAGKRRCPAKRFVDVETTVFLAILCRTFKFNIVEGQVVEPVYGLLTGPKEEIWITVEKRQ